MILFLDAAAFIKLYVSEAGSGVLRRAARSATACYAVDLSYVEVCSAFARAGQSGLLRDKHAQAAKADFERDWQCVNVVVPDAAMLRRAAELTAGDGIGASTAINVAAAEAIQRQLSASLGYRIGIADANGLVSARRLGLPVLELYREEPGRLASLSPR